jgi:hypothetical protein
MYAKEYQRHFRFSRLLTAHLYTPTKDSVYREYTECKKLFETKQKEERKNLRDSNISL